MSWSERVFIIVAIILFIVIVKFSGSNYPKLEIKDYTAYKRGK